MIPDCGKSNGRGFAAFTLIDLLVVAVVLIVLAMGIESLTATPSSKAKARRIKCVNNLKNIGLSYRIFAMDHNGKYPDAIASSEGGMLELAKEPLAAAHLFRCYSNELGVAKILLCPSDTKRMEATNFNSLKWENISYFANLNAATNDATAFLAGDRQMGTPEFVTDQRVFISARNAGKLRWGKEPHSFQGNVVLGDGSVRQLNTNGLNEACAKMTGTNLLAFP